MLPTGESEGFDPSLGRRQHRPWHEGRRCVRAKSPSIRITLHIYQNRRALRRWPRRCTRFAGGTRAPFNLKCAAPMAYRRMVARRPCAARKGVAPTPGSTTTHATACRQVPGGWRLRRAREALPLGPTRSTRATSPSPPQLSSYLRLTTRTASTTTGSTFNKVMYIAPLCATPVEADAGFYLFHNAFRDQAAAHI